MAFLHPQPTAEQKFAQLKLAQKALFLLGPGFFVEDLPPG
jgi:hypothetical protein